jgi:Flp pilus assembly protein TadD
MTSKPIRWCAAVLAVSALCAPVFAAKRPQLALSADERRAAVERAGLDPSSFTDPLAVTDELRDMARRVAGEGSERERLIRLQAHLFDPANYVFDYETRRTLTAVEAHEAGRGNCVSFTNLFIALGRALDIPVHASVAFTDRSEEAIDDLVIVNSHLVATYPDRQRLLVFDFERRQKIVPIGYRAIDDAWLTAVYLNNLGVESLVAGDLDDAREWLEAAVELAPEFVDALTNLAVVYRRSGDADAALDTHLLALRLAPNDPAVRGNLNAIYSILARERDPNSGLLGKADEELMGGRPTQALRLYRRAANADREDAEPHLGAARALIVKGRIKGATKTLRRALELEPGNPEAARLLAGLAPED